MIRVAAESPLQPEVTALMREADAYMASLYPAESNHLLDLDELARPHVRFFVARRDGQALGCGAVMLGSGGEAELKRLFVAPEARGLGVGRALLLALEQAAGEAGVRVLRLETGVAQPEALALYRRHGYRERGPFGGYGPDPLSVFMEKVMAAPAPGRPPG
jgi:putative acetyltransferase